jgi:menaquinone-dependent protoporphyrinogen oxidase
MCTIAVLYATTYGQTQRIAERIADTLRQDGHASFTLDLNSEAGRHIDWRTVSGAVIAASVHAGRHQSAATNFAHVNAGHLNAIPSWLVSVSLSAASTHVEERVAAERIARAFLEGTGWRASQLSSIAGSLAYTQYSFLTRWFMRRIARKEGASTDTSRDHEFTDWSAVAALSRRFSREVWESVAVHDAKTGA